MRSSHSDFWLDSRASSVDVLTGESTTPAKDYAKLAATKRAISNFVSIVTGKSIPVTYAGNESYTNGKAVVISANIKEGDFDPTVGLALHEGAHCLLTDFNTLDKLQEELSTSMLPHHVTTRYTEIKDILNYVEDRRIDLFIYSTAPGYKAYYKAMYKKYFEANIISKALKSADKREVTRENYMFRIINFTNTATDLDALPGLRDIWEVLDLRNIKRLKSTDEALVVAREIDDIINEQIALVTPEQDDTESGTTDSNEDAAPQDGEGKGTGEDQADQGDVNDDGSTAEGSEATQASNQSDLEPLNDRSKKQLENAIKKQEKFMGSDIKKSKLSRKDQGKVEALESAGIEAQEVGGNVKGYNYGSMRNQNGISCVLIKSASIALAESRVYETVFYNRPYEVYAKFAVNGVRLGTMLGRKLQIRNDDTTLKTTRLRTGKIDRRLVSSLGFGAEAVFSRLEVDSFTPALIHISIDASGSMSGERWKKTQTAAIAIAKAASMTANLDVVISYRTTDWYGSVHSPIMMIAYDSTKDKLNKYLNLIPYIKCSGATPEGLCYEATMKEIIKSANGKDAYLINFSDGCPGFSNNQFGYYNEEAIKHTKAQVDNMKAAGIKVLGYFITSDSYYHASEFDQFKRMYGKDTERVNPTQILPLAKTLNKRFATK